MNFGFERPLVAASAFIVIPLVLFAASRLKNPFVAAIPLGAPGGAPFKASFGMSGLVKFLKVLEYLGFFLLFLSAAGPVIKTTETVWLNRGADIIFVLDISPSMAALDMEGKSRFVTAKSLIKEFAEKRPTDCIGLVAIGSDAALLVPPALDREVLADRLQRLQLGEMGDGTAIGTGLAVAAFHLEKSGAKRRITVIITDGESNAGEIHPETAASMINEMGISLWVIGIGSGGEVPIDYVDPNTRIRRTGMFDSRFDTESLRRLGLSGGGIYISAPSTQAFNTAFRGLDDREVTIRRSTRLDKKQPVFLPFLISAFALLIVVRFTRRFFLGAWQ